MFQSVKSKFSLVYIGLVTMIVVLGVLSLWSMVRISRTIDGLITTNYNSITRIGEMREAVWNQQIEAERYLTWGGEDCVDRWTAYAEDFLQYYEAERATIVLDVEEEYIEKIGVAFQEYEALLEQLGTYHLDDSEQAAQAKSFWDDESYVKREKLFEALDSLYISNENALFDRKAQAAEAAQNAAYILGIAFFLAAVVGYLAAGLYTKRFFAPLNEIAQNLRLVQGGKLGRKSVIRSGDEFGMLAGEFNNMLQRLAEYERSTLGSLMRERKKSEMIARGINEPLLVLDGDGSVLLLNKAFEVLFGCREEDAAGHTLEIVLPGSELAAYMFSIQDRAEESPPEKILVLDDGQFYQAKVTVISDVKDEAAGYILLLHNVTEMKRLEKAQSDFIATISHELKTPLTSIVMGAGLLSEEAMGGLTEDQQEIVDTIQEDGQRLEWLVGEMLELSRLESSRTVYHFAPCRIEQIIETSVHQFASIARRNQLALEVCCPLGLPPVRGDAAKLVWVLNNLISNAVKYTGEGGSITIQAEAAEGWLLVSVTDTGIGVPPEFADQIFEKFVQIKGYDLEVRGSGLGLAAAKELIQAHGGKIWCDTSVTQGSRFQFQLPVEEREDIHDREAGADC